MTYLIICIYILQPNQPKAEEQMPRNSKKISFPGCKRVQKEIAFRLIRLFKVININIARNLPYLMHSLFNQATGHCCSCILCIRFFPCPWDIPYRQYFYAYSHQQPHVTQINTFTCTLSPIDPMLSLTGSHSFVRFCWGSRCTNCTKWPTVCSQNNSK